MDNMNLKGIYAIYCKANNTYYIGMTQRSFLQRWHYHLTDLLNHQHGNKRLQHDFLKFGINAFSFSILEILNDDRLIEIREKQYIHYYAAKYKVYNIRDNTKLQHTKR